MAVSSRVKTITLTLAPAWVSQKSQFFRPTTMGRMALVVADFDLAMVKERAKELPLVQGIGDCFLQLACRLENSVQPGAVHFHNGSGKKLALFTAFNVRETFQLLFHFKEPAAVFQPFCCQDVLLGNTVGHGFHPFTSGVGHTACPDGIAQNHGRYRVYINAKKAYPARARIRLLYFLYLPIRYSVPCFLRGFFL